MSNLARAQIYIPENLSFERQQFHNHYVCWFSGPYHTHKVKFSTRQPFEIWKKKVCLKTSFVEIGSNFYNTISHGHVQENHQRKSLLYLEMKNLIIGSLVGFQNALRVRGVGYRFDMSPLKLPLKLTLQVGYSHLVVQKFPRHKFLRTILLNKKATLLKIKSFHFPFLQTFLSRIRNKRPPDVYKGKGIRYQKDFVFRKEGKKKKTN